MNHQNIRRAKDSIAPTPPHASIRPPSLSAMKSMSGNDYLAAVASGRIPGFRDIYNHQKEAAHHG